MHEVQARALGIEPVLRIVERVEERAHDRERDRDRHDEVLLGGAVYQVRERRAAQQLHRDVVDAVEAAELDDVDDVRVLELGGDPRLADELVDEARIVGEPRQEPLERDLDRPPADVERRAIDGRHAAGPDALEHREGPEALALALATLGHRSRRQRVAGWKVEAGTGFLTGASWWMNAATALRSGSSIWLQPG